MGFDQNLHKCCRSLTVVYFHKSGLVENQIEEFKLCDSLPCITFPSSELEQCLIFSKTLELPHTEHSF